MRAPIATKLAELRKMVERIEKTPRKAFTKAQRGAVFDMFGGLCACGCEEPLTGEEWHIDHVKPLADGGEHVLANWQPLIAAHHRDKTSAEAGPRAKAKRIVKRETEGQPPSRLQGRGFQKNLTRRFDGTIVARKA